MEKIVSSWVRGRTRARFSVLRGPKTLFFGPTGPENPIFSGPAAAQPFFCQSSRSTPQKTGPARQRGRYTAGGSDRVIARASVHGGPLSGDHFTLSKGTP